MPGFKKFRYVISYYTRDEINSTSPTQRKASTATVEASTVGRALAAFKRDPEALKDSVVVSVTPDDEGGKYDVGPVEVKGGSGLLTGHSFT